MYLGPYLKSCPYATTVEGALGLTGGIESLPGHGQKLKYLTVPIPVGQCYVHLHTLTGDRMRLQYLITLIWVAKRYPSSDEQVRRPWNKDYECSLHSLRIFVVEIYEKFFSPCLAKMSGKLSVLICFAILVFAPQSLGRNMTAAPSNNTDVSTYEQSCQICAGLSNKGKRGSLVKNIYV